MVNYEIHLTLFQNKVVLSREILDIQRSVHFKPKALILEASNAVIFIGCE